MKLSAEFFYACALSLGLRVGGGFGKGGGERVTKGGYRGGGMGDKQSSPFPFNDK